MTRKALVVGIDAYPTMPLSACVLDATQIAAALSMKECGFSVDLLLDTECTRRQLKANMETFFRNKADTYLFYFSGHGWSTDTGVYLVTIDGEPMDEGVDFAYVQRLIVNLAPKEASVILLLDCCHSGAASARSGPVLWKGSPVTGRSIKQAMLGLPQGRVVVAACKGDENAFEDKNLGHGVFTYHTLQAMLGEAADCEGILSITGLYDYVSRGMAGSKLQTPVFQGDIAGILKLGEGFIPRTEPQPSEERFLEIERSADRYLQEFQSRVAESVSDLSAWREKGYKVACQTLEPVLKWFDREIDKNPMVATRPLFMARHNAATQRLANLCSVEIGTRTTHGLIIGKLGSGTFGTVWKLEDEVTNQTVALKVYHAHDLAIPQKVKRFERGYHAMKQLDHPNIVKVHQLSKCPLGFAMDFIDGPNLRTFAGTLSDPRENVEILLHIAETLQHAHGRGVVHRDVKPENILIRPNESATIWQPFLTDFDLAWFSTATQIFTREGMGSVYYASPEQYATPTAASAHAPTTDVFSFGQLCFFLMTGSDPVPLGVADNIRALKQRLGSGWSSTSAQKFIQLYEDCTKPKPDARIRSFREICDQLFRIYQDLGEFSDGKVFDVNSFIGEVAFTISGLGGQHHDSGFSSLTKLTRIFIEPKREFSDSIDVSVDFQCLQIPTIAQVNNHDQVRKTLMGRVESVLQQFPSARKRNGGTPPFEVFVDYDGVPLTIDGLVELRDLVVRVVDVLERT